MIFSDIVENVGLLKKLPLGGKKSQFKLAPAIRNSFSEAIIKERKPRKASVLILLYPDKNNDTKFLLTERSIYKGTHSAQISFPGGKHEEKDETMLQTALREAQEEVGIDIKAVNIIRQTSDTYIPPSNFMVTPFIGLTLKRPVFTPNYEVAKLIEVDLKDLLQDKFQKKVFIETSYMRKTKVPCFELNNHIVWGATAMLLSEIKDLFLEYKKRT